MLGLARRRINGPDLRPTRRQMAHDVGGSFGKAISISVGHDRKGRQPPHGGGFSRRLSLRRASTGIGARAERAGSDRRRRPRWLGDVLLRFPSRVASMKAKRSLKLKTTPFGPSVDQPGRTGEQRQRLQSRPLCTQRSRCPFPRKLCLASKDVLGRRCDRQAEFLRCGREPPVVDDEGSHALSHCAGTGQMDGTQRA